MCANYDKMPTKNTMGRRIARQRNVIKQVEQNVVSSIDVGYMNVHCKILSHFLHTGDIL